MTGRTDQLESDDKQTELKNAITSGDITKVKALLSSDPSLAGMIYDGGQTTLHLATELNDKRVACELCKILINQGADPTIIDDNKAKALDRLPANYKSQVLTVYNSYKLSKRQAESATSRADDKNDEKVAMTKKDKEDDKKKSRQERIEILDLFPLYVSRLNKLTNQLIEQLNLLDDLVKKYNKNTDKNIDVSIAKEILETTQKITEISLQRTDLINQFKEWKNNYPEIYKNFSQNFVMITSQQKNQLDLYRKIIQEDFSNPREQTLINHLKNLNSDRFDEKFIAENQSSQKNQLQHEKITEDLSTIKQALQDIVSLNKTFIRPGGIKEILKIINTPHASEEWKLHKITEIAAYRAQQSDKLENGRSPLLQEFYLRLANAESNPEALKTRSLDRAKNQITAVQMIREIFSTQSSGETLRAINSILQKTDITIDRKLDDIESKLSSRLSKKNLDPKHEALYTQLLAYIKDAKNGIVPDLKSGKFNALQNETRQKTLEASMESIGFNIRRRS